MQPSLFDTTPHWTTRFDGATYEPAKDCERLTGLLAAVKGCMSDGAWRTLAEIRAAIGGQGSEAGISARLRDLRKEKWGSHVVSRRRREGGLFEYRLGGCDDSA